VCIKPCYYNTVDLWVETVLGYSSRGELMSPWWSPCCINRSTVSGINLELLTQTCRITTKGHNAQKVFMDDVNDTYGRIKTRAAEITKERAAEAAEGGAGVEQIQLHAVDPGTSINIVIPKVDSQDEVEKKARATFESFPPGLQRALESGSLDEVNKVLGKMSVDEAEEVVGQLGEGGMLSLEEQIIDATTEEGQAALKELEAHEKEIGKKAMSGTEDPA